MSQVRLPGRYRNRQRNSRCCCGTVLALWPTDHDLTSRGDSWTTLYQPTIETWASSLHNSNTI